MKRVLRTIFIPVLFGISMCLTASAQAGDLVSHLWVVHIKDGQNEAFESALKKHMAFRQKSGDTWAWQVYTPMVGNDLGYYGIRYCCTSWESVDEYAAWNAENTGIQDHWQRTMDRYVDSYEHYYGKMHQEQSNWGETAPDPAMVGVTSYYIRPGHREAFYTHMSEISAGLKATNWPYNWSWSSRVGGKSVVNLVLPYSDFAAMETPADIAAALGEHLGSREAAVEMFNKFGESIVSSKYEIFRHRKDLSMTNSQLAAKE